MKSSRVFPACALLLLSSILILLAPGTASFESIARPLFAGQQNQAIASRPAADQVAQHCTVFYASDGQVALGGNNEDGYNPRAKISFLPPEEGKYGVAFVGYEDLVWEGAVNDHGLFYDVTAVRSVQTPQEPGKPYFEDPAYQYNIKFKAMRECATVACVLQLYEQYSRGPGSWNGQMMFGDSTGDSAIVEPLTNIRKEGPYQVLENFLQSEVKPENRTQPRYTTAMGMLHNADQFSVDLFRNILKATRQEGETPTLYSTIYDLKKGLIYLYYFHDFDRVVVLDLAQELARGMHSYDMASMFPASPDALQFGKAIASQVALRQETLNPAQVSPELLSSYAGEYEFSWGGRLLVKAEAKTISLRTSLMPWVELVPVSNIRFAWVASDTNRNVKELAFTFQAEGGQVAGLEFDDGTGNKTMLSKVAGPGPATQSTQPQPLSVPQAVQPVFAQWGTRLLAALLLLGVLLVGAIIWRRATRRPGAKRVA